MKHFFLLFFVLGCFNAKAQAVIPAKDNAKFWSEVKTKMPEFKKEFKKYKNYRLEIICTRIDRNDENKPVSLTQYHFGDSISYFYPASTVKLPLAIFVLEKLASQYKNGITNYIKFDSLKVCNSVQYRNYYNIYQRVKTNETVYDFAQRLHLSVDFLKEVNPGIERHTRLKENTSLRISKQPGLLNFRDLITNMLVFSDNDAYNKLYEFASSEFIHFRLHEYRMNNSWITRRFIPCSDDDNRYSCPLKVFNADSTLVMDVKKQYDGENYPLPVPKSKVGKKQMIDGKTVKGGRDFSKHNRLRLLDLHTLMMKVIMHEYMNEKEKIRFGRFEHRYLMRTLGMHPREVEWLRDTCYDNKEDGYTNFLLNGDSKEKIPEHIRMLNVIGMAYGFTTDVAYIMDLKNHTEFFLSARIYTNEDQILGDDNYEYEEIAQPFMKKLGEVILEMENTREKKVVPNLMMISGLFK